MANHTRHFKIGLYGWYLLERNGPDYAELQGFYDFVVRGMRCTYDPVIKGNIEEILNLMNRSEIDFVMAQVGAGENVKDSILTYNYPFSIDECTFAIRNPEYSPRIMALFQTLSLTVWLSLLAFTVLFTLVCYAALKHRRTLEDVFLHVFAICLGQEGNIVSKRAGEFILLCTWLVAMALFTFCFKSVLLSFLSFPPLNSVKTVPELAAAIRAGEYTAYTALYNTYPKFLSESPNEDVKVIGESMLKEKRGHADNLFVEHIRENYPAFPKKAFVFLRTHISVPGVYVSNDNIHTERFATFARKDFCCIDELDMLVHRFHASGIDKKIINYRKYISLVRITKAFRKWNVPLEEKDGDKIRKLSMTDLGGAFILLAAGLFLSFCLLIVELVMKRRNTPLS